MLVVVIAGAWFARFDRSQPSRPTFQELDDRNQRAGTLLGGDDARAVTRPDAAPDAAPVDDRDDGPFIRALRAPFIAVDRSDCDSIDGRAAAGKQEWRAGARGPQPKPSA